MARSLMAVPRLFPAAGVWQIEGPPGTVFFLAVANRQNRPLLHDVERAFDEPQRWPAPEENILLLVNRELVLPPIGETPRDVVKYAFLRAPRSTQSNQGQGSEEV
jgi:hypothetical protein